MDSCATLLRDTLVGHSPTTLTYSDVFWPRKLTVLRPQLPEAGSRTTFVLESCQFYSSQKLLAALHLYCQVTSSEAKAKVASAEARGARSRLPYYICTTKRPVLRPQFRGAASNITCALQAATSERHSCGALLCDTLVGHACGTPL